jgi:hypothetical protein
VPVRITSGRPARIVAGSLTTVSAAAEMFDRFPQYRQGLDWLEQFVTRPLAELGRTGAVCPRLAPALRADTVRLVTIAAAGTSPGHAAGAGRLLMRLFENLVGDADRQPAALLGFFPDLPEQLAADFIDDGHRLLRPSCIARGLMLGEFHPASTVTSVRNRAVPVMRSPVPMFAVRAITPHDVLFLDQPHIPLADRLRDLRHLRTHVDARLSPASRVDLQTRIDGLQRDLTAEGSL